MQLKEIETKKGKVWQVSGYLGLNADNTEARVKKRGFSSKRSAEKWFNNEKVLFEAGNSKYNKKERPDALTVQTLYEKWLDTYQYEVEESTLNKTMCTFSNNILPDWGSVLVTDITPIRLQDYINKMHAKLVDYKKTVNYLKRLLDQAVTNLLIEENPFNHVHYPKSRKAPAVKEYLDTDEFKAFIDVLDKKYCYINQQAFTCLRLASITGMRTGELLGLQWKDIDFNTGNINIVRALGRGLHGATYIKQPKSKSSIRDIYVPMDMIRYLGQWKDNSNYPSPDDFVFTQNGKPLQPLRPNKWLHDVADTYNVAKGISMHKLRHTWATLALDRGASVKQVQTYLGHADASITLNIYSGLTQKAKEDSRSLLAGLIN